MSEHFTNTKLLSIHKIWLDTLLKGLKLQPVRSPLGLKFSSLAAKNSGRQLKNTSAFKGYHNGDYVSLCWQSITVIFSDIMSFQNYIVKDLCFYSIQHKKRKQSISFCFAVKDSLTSENLQMAACVWNRPIMHCKPLRIEYVMYAYWLCLLECMNPSETLH